MDPNNSLQNYYFSVQTDDFKISNAKTFPEIKPGSKSQKLFYNVSLILKNMN